VNSSTRVISNCGGGRRITQSFTLYIIMNNRREAKFDRLKKDDECVFMTVKWEVRMFYDVNCEFCVRVVLCNAMIFQLTIS
jgi:hypothetical protein